MRAQELRTCNQCGHAWKVWRYDTKRHLRGAPTDTGSFLGSHGSALARYQRISDGGQTEDRDGLNMTADRCTKCGSETFTQRRIWHVSKADYQGDETDD